MDLVNELSVTPGTTVTQRKKELDEARFLSVRNLVYQLYKNADGTPLMTYKESLDNREKVKQVVLQYEINSGLLVNDTPTQPQGDTEMPQPPVYSTPPPPAITPVLNSEPKPQVWTPPPFSTPQSASSTVPPVKEAKIRRRVIGATVAPPPGALPPQYVAPSIEQLASGAPLQVEYRPPTGQFTSGEQPQVGYPPSSTSVAPFQPLMNNTLVLPSATPVPTRTVTPFAAPPTITSSVTNNTAIEQLGKRLESAIFSINGLEANLEEAMLLITKMFAAIHHIYLMQPVVAAETPRTLPEFQNFLQQFVGVKNPK